MTEDIIRKTLRPFSLLAVLLLLLNAGLMFSGLLDNYFLNLWWAVHAFLTPLTFFGLFFIAKRLKKTQRTSSIGKNYILYTVIKMILSIIFLLPWLLYKDDSSKPMVYQFFLIFFPFLLIETVLLVRLLNLPLHEEIINDRNQL